MENQTGPVDKSRPAPKPKRKRSTRLTAEAACAVPVPDALAAIDGFREAWDRWVTLRTGKKAWDTAGQVAFILGKLERAHGKGLDVMEGLERAYGSGWVGINPSYLKPLTETRPARSPATLDDLDNLPRRRGRSPLAMTDAERESRAGWTPPPNVALEDRRRWRQEQREEQARRRLRLVAEQEVAK